MTDRDAFKIGFLLRCAEEHLTAEETRGRIKSAHWTGTVAGLGALGAGTGLAASAGIGAGAGWLGAKLTEPDMDAEDAKMQELIAAFRQQADQAKRTAARIAYRTRPLRPRGRSLSPIAA
jgi:hypothetical protein